MTHDRSTPQRDPISGLPNPLPTELAFVIQFGSKAREADPIESGRIEHVITGRQRKFQSAAELLEALREMVTNIRQDR